MSRPALVSAAILLALAAVVLPAQERVALGAVDRGVPPVAGRPSFAEPAPSPDGTEIAFESGGDIWTVPSSGGVAHLLVADPAYDHRPLYSPDGTRLAFVSTRSGNGDIYVLDLRSGAVTRLTFDDGGEQLDAWSRDGAWIYFSSSTDDIAGMNDVLRVRATGGTPMVVAGDRYASEFWAAPAPDGQSVAIAARGNAVSQWWRHGHSHLDISELWLVHPGDPPAYTRVSDGTQDGKEMWPMWAPDGHTLWYVSDRGGTENLWKRPVGGAAQRVTSFRDGRVLWPQMSLDGRAIVFERDFGIWRFDAGTGETRAVPITLRGAPAMPTVEHLTLTSGFRDLALSPDGRKVAVVARGDVFAASATDGGTAARVTATPGPEQGVAWLPDSRRLVYASSRAGVWRLYLYDFVARAESLLTPNGDAIQPTVSPDGRWIAYSRNAGELHLLELATHRDHLAATGHFDRPPFVGANAYAFSPDSRWIAFISSGSRGFENAFVVPVSGGTPRQVSFLANSSGNAVAWSPDGTFLLLLSNQRTESPQLARVDLVPPVPRFHEDVFRALFPGDSAGATRPAPGRDSSRAARTPPPPRTEIDFDGIRERATMLNPRVDVQRMEIAPDGKRLLITGSAAGQSNLWLLSLDELAPASQAFRQLTTSQGGEQDAQWSADGREIWYLEGGRVQAMNAESRQVRSVALTAELDVDFDTEKIEVFRQAWSYLRDNFFDASMHGADWNAVGARIEAQVAGARSPDEMRRLLSLMIGELNASHLGIGGGSRSTPAAGRLGARFSRTEYERTGKLRFATVIPGGPLSRDVKPGEYLLGVDSITLDASSNLDEVLSHTIGRRVSLRIGDAGGSGTRTVVVQPVSTGVEKNLLYRAWVEGRRAYVDSISGGRLGYVHMIDMGAGSLAQLYLDLDVENQSKEGLVIDIRNNNGGFVNSYALDVFSRRPFMTMTPRGRPEYSARQRLGQRVFDRPTVLVVNQHSLSDAEDFTEGYRTLGLGPVVGEPTAGWIIYTSNTTLLDGTTVRLPSTRIRDHAGKDMELHPRPVDVRVDRPVGESYSGRDSQLDAAVKALLARIHQGTSPG